MFFLLVSDDATVCSFNSIVLCKTVFHFRCGSPIVAASNFNVEIVVLSLRFFFYHRTCSLSYQEAPVIKNKLSSLNTSTLGNNSVSKVCDWFVKSCELIPEHRRSISLTTQTLEEKLSGVLTAQHEPLQDRKTRSYCKSQQKYFPIQNHNILNLLDARAMRADRVKETETLRSKAQKEKKKKEKPFKREFFYYPIIYEVKFPRSVCRIYYITRDNFHYELCFLLTDFFLFLSSLQCDVLFILVEHDVTLPAKLCLLLHFFQISFSFSIFFVNEKWFNFPVNVTTNESMRTSLLLIPPSRLKFFLLWIVMKSKENFSKYV